LGIIFVFALGYAVFFYLFSPLIIGFSYGPTYLEAVSALRILGFSAIPFFLNTLPGNIIQNSKKIKGFLIFALLNFGSVVAFGVFLIPRYSIIGASLAVLLGEIVGLIFNNLYVFKILNGDN
jgi:O-antigen/teichoic acid export membrane protein